MTYRNRSCSSHRRITIHFVCSPPQFPFLSSAPREDGPNLNRLHFSCCPHSLHHVPWLSIFNKLYPVKRLTDQLLSGVSVDPSKALMITAKEITPVFLSIPFHFTLAWENSILPGAQPPLSLAEWGLHLPWKGEQVVVFLHFLYLNISKINRF